MRASLAAAIALQRAKAETESRRRAAAEAARAAQEAAELQTAAAEAATLAAVANERAAALRDLVNDVRRRQWRLQVLTAYKRVLNPRAGIGALLLGRARTALQQYINVELNELGAQFTVELDEGLDIFLRIADTMSVHIDTASGYQRFVTSIAMRCSLARIARVPLLDCLIIDEGFGCLDGQHRDAVVQYLTNSARRRPLTLIVTHIETMYPCITRPLHITREQNVSYIRNSELPPPALPPAEVKASRDVMLARSRARRARARAPLLVQQRQRAEAVIAADDAIFVRVEPADTPKSRRGDVWRCTVCDITLSAGYIPRHVTTLMHRRAITAAVEQRFAFASGQFVVQDDGSVYCICCDHYMTMGQLGFHAATASHAARVT